MRVEPGVMLARLAEERSLQLTGKQIEQYETYYRLLAEWNEKMNLTAITEKEQVYIKHFYDSLTLSFYYPADRVRSMADIGSGAGFPGIPLKIAFPHIRLTIVDSLQKRIGFLQTLCEALGLKDVQCVHARAEDAARTREHREAYDLVTARAVARLNVLAEFCLPFCAKNGVFAAMKGPGAGAELEDAKFAISELGGEWMESHNFTLPNHEEAERNIILIRKVKPTPRKYPRKAGVPIKQPLVGNAP